MAEMFHVYVEGAVDPSPDAQKKLAEIMATRYGLPLADVTARLAKGRFRVKANVDRATADIYLRDLGAVGAKVVIDVAGGSAGPGKTPSIPAPSRTATPASGLPARTSSPSIPTPSRTATPASGLRVATPPAGNKAVTSGLAAAFETSRSASQDLGVLGGDSGSFALSSVDGGSVDDGRRGVIEKAAAVEPEPELPKPTPVARPVKVSRGSGIDAFAPPDAQEQEQNVELASDEPDRRTRKAEEARRRASAPPVNAPGVATPLLQRKASTSIAPQTEPVTALPPRGRLGPLSMPRNRFAAGVFVSILLGFLPMHMIASYREHEALQKVDSKFVADAASAPDPGAWAALDEPALRDKKAAQHGVIATSVLLWALFAGGIGYVWFKRVPWDKLDTVA